MLILSINQKGVCVNMVVYRLKSVKKMLWKLLLTMLAIAVGYLILKNRQASNIPKSSIKNISPKQNIKKLRWLFLFVLILSLLGGSVTVYLSWQNDHKVYQVKIINTQTGQQEKFKAYKKDLGARTFTTITGQQVSTSDNERMVFEELK